MDYNEFLIQSMQAGARVDEMGNIHHTPASAQLFGINQEQQRQRDQFNQELDKKPLGFWDSLFG